MTVHNDFWWAILMSSCIYAGSMQFVAITLLTSGFNIVAVVVMTLAINARHLFYGLSILDKFKDMGKKNTLLSIGGGTIFYMLLVQFIFI